MPDLCPGSGRMPDSVRPYRNGGSMVLFCRVCGAGVRTAWRLWDEGNAKVRDHAPIHGQPRHDPGVHVEDGAWVDVVEEFRAPEGCNQPQEISNA